MAAKIILKKSNTPTSQPGVSDLEYGELAINYDDGILYYKNNAGAVDIIARKAIGGASGISITRIATTYTAGDGDFLLADPSLGSFTLTLPSAPTTGSFVTIFDGGSWTSDPLIIDPGLLSIDGGAGGSTINLEVGNVRVDLVYNGTTWKTHIPVDRQWVENRLTAFEDDVITYAIALG
jgi:hypothetical protein